MEVLISKISKHKDFLELLQVIKTRTAIDISQDEFKDDAHNSVQQKLPPSTRRTKGDGSDISLGKFSFTKPMNSIRDDTQANLKSIQESQYDKSVDKNNLDSMKSISSPIKKPKETLLNSLHQNLKTRRDEEDQLSRLKQIQYENAQIHLENLKFSVDRKLYLKSEEYTKTMLRYLKALKFKIQDSYYVATVPFIIDSIVFEEDLKRRDVSLITESLMRITKRVPKTPMLEEEEVLSNKGRGKGKDDEKEESRVAYEDEEVTIVDEKRLQILTAITFRDLFQKKTKILELRKSELFYQSLVYLDYDTIKIISVKNKSLLVGCIHELQKSLTKMQSANQNDDMSSVNNDGTKKLTPTYLFEKSIFLYEKLEKLQLKKVDLTNYRDQTQQIKEMLAARSFYQGCKIIMEEVANIRAFDGIPLLVDYQDYVTTKDLEGFKEAQNQRKESKDKLLKYMTLVGRLRGIQFVLKNFEKSPEVQRESLAEYLDQCKEELQSTNETLISDCIYKAFKLRTILKEYYQTVGQLSIYDSICKQLQPYYLPAYFKMNWYIDAWNIMLYSIVEKEKLSISNADSKRSSSRSNGQMSRSPAAVTSNLSVRKQGTKSVSIQTTQYLSKLSGIQNKLQRILELQKECIKQGAEKVKDECEQYLVDEENELQLLEKVYKTLEANDRKLKSSAGRRKTIDFKIDTYECKLNPTKEKLDLEQYS